MDNQLSHRVTSCCKLRYKPRWFSSKGASLILVWAFLCSCSLAIYPVHSVPDLLKSPLLSHHAYKYIFIVVFCLTGFVFSIVPGWLADTRYGRYRVVRFGLVLMWLGSCVLAVFSLVTISINMDSNWKSIMFFSLNYFGSLVAFAGFACFFTNVLQCGIEQMPDASAENMTAYIAWFVYVVVAGAWLSVIVANAFKFCLHERYKSLLNSIPVILLSVGLCSLFLYQHLLVDHRQTHNPVKTVYQVLKYAKQHKYPVNRSAFTYWEEEIPSRIDLGKSKYGGPFTTEQVEDVKVFLRISVVLLFLGGLLTAVTLISLELHNVRLHHGEKCSQIVVQSDLLCGFFPATLFVLVYEFGFYPIFKYWLPTMIRRIVISAFLTIVLSICILLATIAVDIIPNTDFNTNFPSVAIFFSTFFLLLSLLFITSTLEFIYAQSPESMKGFFIACLSFSGLVSLYASASIFTVWHQYCTISVCRVIFAGPVVAFSCVLFILYCLVARWYKRRERDEPCNEQAIIEDIFSRRVEHNDTELYL